MSDDDEYIAQIVNEGTVWCSECGCRDYLPDALVEHLQATWGKVPNEDGAGDMTVTNEAGAKYTESERARRRQVLMEKYGTVENAYKSFSFGDALDLFRTGRLWADKPADGASND